MVMGTLWPCARLYTSGTLIAPTGSDDRIDAIRIDQVWRDLDCKRDTDPSPGGACRWVRITS